MIASAPKGWRGPGAGLDRGANFYSPLNCPGGVGEVDTQEQEPGSVLARRPERLMPPVFLTDDKHDSPRGTDRDEPRQDPSGGPIGSF